MSGVKKAMPPELETVAGQSLLNLALAGYKVITPTGEDLTARTIEMGDDPQRQVRRLAQQVPRADGPPRVGRRSPEQEERTMTYEAELASAQDAVSLGLGHCVIRRPGDPNDSRSTDTYQTQVFDWDEKGKRYVKSVSPTNQAHYDAWAEAVRYRMEHDKACKTIWEMYEAGMGTTIEEFRGVESGVVEDLALAGAVYKATKQVRESDGTFTTEIAGVVISKAPTN